MGRFLNPDNSSFQKVLNSKIYVDKTNLIEYTNDVIDTLQGFICNSRPRRFGKSITADMLTAYYSKGCHSEEIFGSLAIGKSRDFQKYLNRCNVIHLDIQWFLTAGGDNNIVEYINNSVLEELRTAFPAVELRGESSLAFALSKIYAKTGDRFVVIIDEWDVLIRDEKADTEIQDKYINFLRSMFKGSEPTKFIRLAWLTGILPIKKLKTESALNNFDEFTMIYPGQLAPFIGFTEKEVKTLCGIYDRDYEKVRQWYDGYVLGKYHIYNPRAVIGLMQTGEYRSYWSSTGTYESLIPYINMDFDGLKGAIIEALSGGETELNVSTFQNDLTSFKNRDDVLTLLIHLGYLAYRQQTQTAYIPNEEIRLELLNAVRSEKWDDYIRFQNNSDRLLDDTLEGNETAVASQIEKMHNSYASAIQYNDENSLSSVLSLAYLATLRYYFRPIREFPTGRGFADLVYLPKSEYQRDYPALIIELKWNRKAETALDQIKKKKYTEAVSDYTGNILLVGISYDRRTKEHMCSIEEWKK